MKHLLGHESINVNSFSRNIYCVCPRAQTGTEFRSHANLMTAPWAEFSSVFLLPKKMTLWNPWEGKKWNHFNNCQSVLVVRNQAIKRITRKSMLACDILIYGQLSSELATPRQEKSYNSLTSELLVEESGKDSTKQYRLQTTRERKRRLDDERISYLHVLLSCWQSSGGIHMLLHKPQGEKEMSCAEFIATAKQMPNFWLWDIGHTHYDWMKSQTAYVSSFLNVRNLGSWIYKASNLNLGSGKLWSTFSDMAKQFKNNESIMKKKKQLKKNKNKCQWQGVMFYSCVRIINNFK